MIAVFFQKKEMEKIDHNAAYWKSKAVRRNKENKELKKRIKELVASRNLWKGKHKANKELAGRYSKEIELIKKKLEKILKL